MPSCLRGEERLGCCRHTAWYQRKRRRRRTGRAAPRDDAARPIDPVKPLRTGQCRNLNPIVHRRAHASRTTPRAQVRGASARSAPATTRTEAASRPAPPRRRAPHAPLPRIEPSAPSRSAAPWMPSSTQHAARSTAAAPAMSVRSASPTASTCVRRQAEPLQHRLVDRRVGLSQRPHVAAQLPIAHRQRPGAQHADAAADHLQVRVAADHRQAVVRAVRAARARTRPCRRDCGGRRGRCSARSRASAGVGDAGQRQAFQHGQVAGRAKMEHALAEFAPTRGRAGDCKARRTASPEVRMSV